MLSFSSMFSSWNSIGNTVSYTGITCASGSERGSGNVPDDTEDFVNFDWYSLISISPHKIIENREKTEANTAATVTGMVVDPVVVMLVLGLCASDMSGSENN